MGKFPGSYECESIVGLFTAVGSGETRHKLVDVPILKMAHAALDWFTRWIRSNSWNRRRRVVVVKLRSRIS